MWTCTGSGKVHVYIISTCTRIPVLNPYTCTTARHVHVHLENTCGRVLQGANGNAGYLDLRSEGRVI